MISVVLKDARRNR